MGKQYKNETRNMWDGDAMFELLSELKQAGTDLSDVEISKGYESTEIEVEWACEESTLERDKRLAAEAVQKTARLEERIKHLRGAIKRTEKQLADHKAGKMPF